MRKISIFIIFSLILFSNFSIMGFAETDDEMIIKIGLQYTPPEASERKPLVPVSTSTTFELGQLVNGTYVTIVPTTISSFTYDLDNGYHAVIGPFASYDEARASATQMNGFVVRKEGFYAYGQSGTQGFASGQSMSYGGTVQGPENTLVILKSGNSVVLGYDCTYDYVMVPTGSGLRNSTFIFGDRSYRGGLGAKRQNSNDVSLVNYVRMNEYLYGVVPREMSPAWPIEALKAQAVVARSFAIANFNKFSHYGFNLDNTSVSQVYGGHTSEGTGSTQAVVDTRGIVLKYGNTVISGFYHSNSGGFTENSENVYSAELPYIKGVYDPFSLGAPNDQWELSYSDSFIEQKLKNYGQNIGDLNNFYIEAYTDNNRVKKARFEGTNGTVVLPNQDIRKVFGYNEVKSTLIKVIPNNAITITNGSVISETSPTGLSVISGNGQVSKASDLVVWDGSKTVQVNMSADNYTIQGKGWGHGLGMSQYGAKHMAEAGVDFEEILTYYYSGTHIE